MSLLQTFAYVGHHLLRGIFGVFEGIHRMRTSINRKIAGIGQRDRSSFHFDKVTAYVGPAVLHHALHIGVGIAVAVNSLFFRQHLQIALTYFVVPLFQQVFIVQNVNTALAHLHLFAQQIGAAVFAVIEQIHKLALHGGKSQLLCQIGGDAVVKQCGIQSLTQQYPCAGAIGGITRSQQIRTVFQLELISFFGPLPRPVAAPAQIGDGSGMAEGSVCIHQGQRGGGEVGMFVALFNIGKPLIDGIITEQEQCRKMLRAHHGYFGYLIPADDIHVPQPVFIRLGIPPFQLRAFHAQAVQLCKGRQKQPCLFLDQPRVQLRITIACLQRKHRFILCTGSANRRCQHQQRHHQQDQKAFHHRHPRGIQRTAPRPACGRGAVEYRNDFICFPYRRGCLPPWARGWTWR